MWGRKEKSVVIPPSPSRPMGSTAWSYQHLSPHCIFPNPPEKQRNLYSDDQPSLGPLMLSIITKACEGALPVFISTPPFRPQMFQLMVPVLFFFNCFHSIQFNSITCSITLGISLCPLLDLLGYNYVPCSRNVTQWFVLVQYLLFWSCYTTMSNLIYSLVSKAQCRVSVYSCQEFIASRGLLVSVQLVSCVQGLPPWESNL